jgi:4'-phosphopantetheinyl transferase
MLDSSNSIYVNWTSPPAEPVLAGDLHVWLVKLSEHSPQAFTHLLSSDELGRASRFHFQKHRNHFIVARGALRSILGQYLKLDPKLLQFTYSSYGKPSLAESSQANLEFNMSHSHELALYAVATNCKVGIDVEHMRSDVAHKDIAERFFSHSEVNTFCNLPEELKTEGFFNCWTRKEAFIKAIGEGLSYPLDKFSVSLTPGEPASILSIADDNAEAKNWNLISFSPRPDYVAAAAIYGNISNVQYWTWHI